MLKETPVLLPETVDILNQMGLQIKNARFRRKISAELAAERAGISMETFEAIEQGEAAISIGCYAAVLHALNYMEKDLLLVAKDEELEMKLQEISKVVKAN